MDYQNGVVKGSLKLKTDLPKKKVTKKAKQQTKESSDKVVADKPPVIVVKKTKAEESYEKLLKERRMDKVSKMASKSHKEKVQEFNRYLNQISEHYEVPKVNGQ